MMQTKFKNIYIYLCIYIYIIHFKQERAECLDVWKNMLELAYNLEHNFKTIFSTSDPKQKVSSIKFKYFLVLVTLLMLNIKYLP
jgi:hypothetical protein